MKLFDINTSKKKKRSYILGIQRHEAIQVQGDIYVGISNRYRGYEMRISWYEFFERENA